MNIDKFGHHVHKRLRISDYLDVVNNNTLKKTESGYYDLKYCRLRGLGDPLLEDEAVNKKFVDSSLSQYYTKKECDIKIAQIVDSYLKLFTEQLHVLLDANYFTKEEINQLVKKKK